MGMGCERIFFNKFALLCCVFCFFSFVFNGNLRFSLTCGFPPQLPAPFSHHWLLVVFQHNEVSLLCFVAFAMTFNCHSLLLLFSYTTPREEATIENEEKPQQDTEKNCRTSGNSIPTRRLLMTMKMEIFSLFLHLPLRLDFRETQTGSFFTLENDNDTRDAERRFLALKLTSFT